MSPRPRISAVFKKCIVHDPVLTTAIIIQYLRSGPASQSRCHDLPSESTAVLELLDSFRHICTRIMAPDGVPLQVKIAPTFFIARSTGPVPAIDIASSFACKRDERCAGDSDIVVRA